MKPTRIQRRRTRGWRMPPGAVYVGRGTKWANPYQVAKGPDGMWLVACPDGGSIRRYTRREWLATRPDLIAEARRELSGRPLACWCPLDRPCHADVLLHVANQEAQ